MAQPADGAVSWVCFVVYWVSWLPVHRCCCFVSQKKNKKRGVCTKRTAWLSVLNHLATPNKRVLCFFSTAHGARCTSLLCGASSRVGLVNGTRGRYWLVIETRRSTRERSQQPAAATRTGGTPPETRASDKTHTATTHTHKFRKDEKRTPKI